MVGSSPSKPQPLRVRNSTVAKIGKLRDFNPQSQKVGLTTPAGGSQSTPQIALMKQGSGVLGSSKPKSPQKLRG